MPIRKWKKLEPKYMLVNLKKIVKVADLIHAIEDDMKTVDSEDDTRTFQWSNFIKSLSAGFYPEILVLKLEKFVRVKFLLQQLKQEKRIEVPMKDLAEIFLNAEE